MRLLTLLLLIGIVAVYALPHTKPIKIIEDKCKDKPDKKPEKKDCEKDKKPDDKPKDDKPEDCKTKDDKPKPDDNKPNYKASAFAIASSSGDGAKALAGAASSFDE